MDISIDNIADVVASALRVDGWYTATSCYVDSNNFKAIQASYGGREIYVTFQLDNPIERSRVYIEQLVQQQEWSLDVTEHDWASVVHLQLEESGVEFPYTVYEVRDALRALEYLS
jgi:hypothetical protein